MNSEDTKPELDERIWRLLVDGLEPRPAPPEARSRLLGTVEGPGRYLPFVSALSGVFDLDLDSARSLLGRAADRSNFRQDTPPFVAHLDFKGGPSCAGLRAGFVVMEGGAIIPRHRHTEREVTLVLEGSIISDGRACTAGEVLDMAPGSEHVFEVGASGVVFAVLRGRVRFLG